MSMPNAEPSARSLPFRAVKRLTSLIWWLVLVLLVLLAVYVGLGHQMTRSIDDYRAQLEQSLSRELGQTVKIDHLAARWRWLDPIVEASGVTVRSPAHPDDPDITLQHLRIRLDTLRSLLNVRLILKDFEADGLDLTLTATEQGRLQVGKLVIPLRTEPSAWFEQLSAWVYEPHIRITRVNLDFAASGQPPQSVDIPQLDLVYDQGVVRASGRAMQAGTTRQIASFNLKGSHFFQTGFDGQLYVKVDSGRLFDRFVEGFSWQHLGIMGFDLRGEGWLRFEAGRLIRVNAAVAIPYLQVRARNSTVAPLENVAAHVGWQAGTGSKALADNGFGALTLTGLSWRWLGQTSNEFDVQLTDSPDGQVINADHLPVEPLWRLASALQLMPQAAATALNHYQPAGQLDDVRLRIPRAGKPTFDLVARLSGVSADAYGGAPGASGLDGTLMVNPSGGQVDVDAQQLQLGFPRLFDHAWSLNSLKTRVNWRVSDQAVRVFSDQIDMVYQDKTRISGAFDLALESAGDDTLGLTVRVRDGDAGMLSGFVPVHAVGNDLYQWLTTRIPTATIDQGVYFGHGRIGHAAPPGSFSSSMQYQFSGATVRYDDHWPAVTDASGLVAVHNRNARVHLDEGKTGGIALAPTDVTVTPEADSSVVAIKTAATFDGASINQWMKDTPLANLAGPAGQSVQFGGQYRLDLGLTVPLAPARSVGVDAVLDTNDAAVHYPSADLSWTGIAGKLAYSSAQGFTDDTLTAQFMDQPVKVRFATTGSGKRLQLTQTGNMPVKRAFARAGLDDPARAGVTGAFDYQVQLAVSPDTASTLTFTSGLTGLAVDWPAPLGKSPGETTPLNARLDWSGDGRVDLTGQWRHRLSLRARWVKAAFERGQLALNADATALPEHPGFVVSGSLLKLDPSSWIDRLDKLGGQKTTSTRAVHTWLDRIAVQVGTLTLEGRDFHQVRLQLKPDASGWHVDAESTALAGTLFLPVDPAAVTQAQFTRLHLAVANGRDESAAPGPDITDRLKPSDIRDWPTIRVRIDDLRKGDNDYGAWSFLLKPEKEALTIEQLTGHLNSMNFNGQLRWQLSEDSAHTDLSGTMNGGNLTDLSSLVPGDIPLKNKKSQMKLDLSWPGGPADFTLGSVNGTVSVRFDDGVILQSNNTAQLFRIFNLLNSDTLWRRLKLDFSDLYEAGVAFDALSGKATLKDGTLSLAPELQIVGPSGAFKFSGSTGLVDETLDMRLVVVLPLTQNLPLAALLMGASAPIGGALFVLDKVLGDPLSKLTSATYSVKGTWSDPDVKLRNVFDTGK